MRRDPHITLESYAVMSDVRERYVWPERIAGPGMEKLTEKQLQKQIILTASYCGYIRNMHMPYSIDMPSGWPDLTLVRVDPRAPDIAFFEIKGPRGQVMKRQLEWLADLRATGHHAYLVQPKDWDTIVEILRNVYQKPQLGTGWIDPDLFPRFTMDQFTGERQ